MNVTESTQVQTLLKYLLDDDAVVTCQDGRTATEAARRLADRSHKVLKTGLVGDDLPELGGCDGCDECMRAIVDVPTGGLL